MKRGVLVIALLTVALWAVAQTAGTTYGGVNTSTGTAVIVAPPWQPSLVTPIAHLGTAAPVVGATSATSGNMAGAMSSTMATISAPAPVPMVAEIRNQVPVVMVNSQAGASPILPETSGATISGATSPAVPFNTGVGSFSGAYEVGTLAENQTSLGELAREFRGKRATEQARTFTNEDVQRMNQTTGTSLVGGTSGAVTAAPGTMTQPAGNAPAVAQPGTIDRKSVV